MTTKSAGRKKKVLVGWHFKCKFGAEKIFLEKKRPEGCSCDTITKVEIRKL